MNLTEKQEDRFWSRIHADGICWEWQGNKNTQGRGQFYANGRQHQAHRVAYEILVGPVPDGLELDHLCRNPICANPDHLEPVTHRENILRGYNPAAANARKTHCKRGHPFDEVNTYHRRDGNRDCRQCIRDANRRHKARKAAA